MLTITDRAVDKAKEILIAEGKDNWGIRIYCAGESCCGPSYGLDINEMPSAGDEVINRDGLKLFIEKFAFERLSGMQIDYYEDIERSGFIITGLAPSCGSGCSGC